MGWRIALGVFLILHGLIHPGVYAPPATDPSRPDFHRSWLLARFGVDRDNARRLSIALSLIAAIAFAVAGIALLAGAGWWAPAAIAASVLSLVLLLGYFQPWLSLGVLINAAIIWAALAGWPELD